MAELGAEAAFAQAVWRPSRHAVLRPLRPLAILALASDLAVRVLTIVFASAPRPLAGVMRALYHGYTALGIGWPCAVGALALWAFLPARRGVTVCVMLGVWLGLGVGMTLAYPLPLKRIGGILFAIELLVSIVAFGCAFFARKRITWGRLQTTALLFAGGELVVALFGPYATNPFTDWMIADVLYAVEFFAFATWYALVPR